MDEINFIDTTDIQIDIKNIWEEAKHLLEPLVSSVTYDVWIATLEPIDLKGNTLVLSTPSFSSQNVLNQKYKTHITDSVNKIHSAITAVEFVIESGEEETQATTAAPIVVDQPKKKAASSCFNPKFTFDNFVVGSSNQFVAAAARAVADRPGTNCNPLFIWGGVGLGKTHLLHAIGNEICEKKKDLNVVYVTTEKFTNDLISSIQNSKKGANSDFREKYRTCDVLIVDDIQFIINKNSVQEEFFHTFNELVMNGKQIVISSDKMPKDINPLEERLRSRFESGLIADVGVPDIETRIAIINKKAQLERYNISREAVEYIAEISKTNIREMEGRLSRAVFYSGLLGESITSLETTREALKDMVTEDNSEIDANKVLECVCKFYNIKKEELLARKRTKEVAMARQVAMYLISELIAMPLASIGNIFGKDHATVIYAKNKINEDMANNKKLAIEINDMKQMIKGK